MIQNALHILGPVPSIHLDPFVLLHAQPAGVGGYVVICRNDRGSGREYHLLCFDDKGPDICVRLTPESRSFIAFDTAQSEYNRMDKGRVLVQLFTIDGPAMERFYTTVRNEPCFKIRVDTLRRRQVAMLVRAYGSGELLAERNDFTSEQPRMEFQATIPGQRLPAFAMGYGRGGFLLYRCPGAEDGRRPETLQAGVHVISSGVHSSPFPTASLARPASAPLGAHPTQAAAHTTPTPASADVAMDAARLRSLMPAGVQPASHTTPTPASPDVAMDAVRSRSFGLASAQPGVHIIPTGGFVEIAQEPQGPGSARTKRAGRSTEPPDQLEFLSGSKLAGNAAPPATSNSRGNTASSAVVSPRGSARDREGAPIPDIAGLLQRLVDAFRKQTMSILGRKGPVVFESCERQLRKQAPQFRSDEIDDETAILALDLIDAVVHEAPLLKRSKLRRITLALIADLYNKHFEVLNWRGLIPRVEEFYFTHKK